MNFVDLYHLDKKCENIFEHPSMKEQKVNEKGDFVLEFSKENMLDLLDVLRDCRGLVYELCQTNIKDILMSKRG
jgi:hypothetical protein